MMVQGSKEGVLVVDDESCLCELMSEVLRAEDYQPTIFTDPREALAASEQRSFAMAFVDINMPGMSGIELASKIKTLNPLCEIIIMTGFASIENAIQAIKIGASDYLRKPFSISEISFCIQRFRERSALREQISMAEERYHRLVQNAPMLIFKLRRDFQLDFINQACLPITGFEPEEAMSSADWLTERIYSDDRGRVRSLLQNAFDSDRASFTTECRLVRRDERLIYALIKCIPNASRRVEEDGGRIEGIIVDITDRVLLEKTLVQREKLNTLGAIAAEVAHEIRNPLMCIGGFARRLQKKLPEAAEVTIILREAERLEKILGRIRDYLRPVEVVPRECSINEVIRECVGLLSPEIGRRNAECLLLLDDALSPVMVDPDILAEVCINLIRNALTALGKGGKVVIRTFETDQNLHIDFKNETSGKKLKKPEILFLPFDEGGESIGLPLSYQLLKNMGGLLSFAEEENQVIFTVSLPKSAEAAARSRSGSAEGKGSPFPQNAPGELMH